MEPKNFIAKAETKIHAPVAVVWDAFINPETIKKYMFGTTVISNWKEGSQIIWKGEWQGKQYEDKGEILQLKPGELLQFTHFSPLEGLPDQPENYHTVTIELTEEGEQVYISLSQDHNSTEQAREHAEKNWSTMLDALKKMIEENH